MHFNQSHNSETKSNLSKNSAYKSSKVHISPKSFNAASPSNVSFHEFSQFLALVAPHAFAGSAKFFFENSFQENPSASPGGCCTWMPVVCFAIYEDASFLSKFMPKSLHAPRPSSKIEITSFGLSVKRPVISYIFLI